MPHFVRQELKRNPVIPKSYEEKVGKICFLMTFTSKPWCVKNDTTSEELGGAF